MATAALLDADAGAAAAVGALAQTELRAAADAVAQIDALGTVAELRRDELAIGEQRALLMGLTNARTSIDRSLAWPILQMMQGPAPRDAG